MEGKCVNTGGHKPEVRFVCIYCAYFWNTTDYSDPKPFRRDYARIQATCPRCGVTTENAIEINKVEMEK